ALLGAIVGTVDEILQWVVPDRYWDFRDLVLNGGASVLVQIALWRVVRKTTLPVKPQTVLFLCRLAACQIALLILVLAATPQRLAALARSLPFLEPLAVSHDVMCEYGFMHHIDDRTSFRSRLSDRELLDQDLNHSAEAAARLDDSPGRYGRFLREVSPAEDPFTYEARVHVFARDRNLAEAPRHAEGTREHRRSMTTAARENRILEQVFGDTLSQTTCSWSGQQRTAVESAEDLDTRFVSKVAGHLITDVSEPVLRFLMLAALAVLVAADVILSRSLSQPTQE
ncbi:MAG: VanZ family protein, partial [Thermoanaerobaculales bacterium]|nr:VanZ family protein [Thermoanaerobaculales bacterium]